MRKYQKISIPKSLWQKQQILKDFVGKQVLARVREEKEEYLLGLLTYEELPCAALDSYQLHDEDGKAKRFFVKNLSGLLVQL